MPSSLLPKSELKIWNQSSIGELAPLALACSGMQIGGYTSKPVKPGPARLCRAGLCGRPLAMTVPSSAWLTVQTRNQTRTQGSSSSSLRVGSHRFCSAWHDRCSKPSFTLCTHSLCKGNNYCLETNPRNAECLNFLKICISKNVLIFLYLHLLSFWRIKWNIIVVMMSSHL